MTIRTRIAVTVALAVLGSTVTVTYAAYELERHGTENRFVLGAQASLDSDLTQAAQAAKQVAPDKRGRAVADFVRHRIGVDWRVSTEGGTAPTHACTADHSANQMESDAARGVSSTRWVMLCDDRMHLAVAGPIVPGVGLIEFYDYEPARQQLARLRSDLIWLDLAGLVLAIVLGALVGVRIGRPIRRAATTARELGAGNLSARMSVRGRSELSDLGEAFNAMADKLQSTLTDLQRAMADLRGSHDQQRQFVSDVSHELRTPLAAMLAAADGMSGDDPVTRLRAEELLTGQTRRLTRLVEDLLEISRFDAGQARLEVDEVSLDDLARDAVQTVAPEAGVHVMTMGDVVVQADARRVHTILRNLVGNAVQHGAAPIDVVVDGRAEDVAITVADDGPGIAPELAGLIFQRFVRADPSRSTSHARSNTSGLGLAIAEENARLHGATITLSPTGRTAFTLRLPRRQSGEAELISPLGAHEVPTRSCTGASAVSS